MAVRPVSGRAGDAILSPMDSASATWSLVDAVAPLIAAFGDRLRLWRDGEIACWGYDGMTVAVRRRLDGALDAAFLDRPCLDAVAGEPAAAAYRRLGAVPYAMSPVGAERIVADMTAFFEGVREPRFIFVSACALPRAS